MNNLEFPELLILRDNKEYVRHIIETIICNTSHLENYININQLKNLDRFKFYQDAVHPLDEMVASHQVIENTIKLFGSDYRYRIDKHQINNLSDRTKDDTSVGRVKSI